MLSVVGGYANIIHACGTFWNHSCRCHIGHQLDVTGMLAVIGFNAFYLIYRWIRLRNPEMKSSKVQLPFVILFLGYMVILWPISDVYYNENCINTVEAPLVVIHVIAILVPLIGYSYFHRNVTVSYIGE